MLARSATQRACCRTSGAAPRHAQVVRAQAGAVPTASTAAPTDSAPTAAVAVDPSKVTRVKLITRTNCELGVSRYPKFAYNAGGGGGWATATHTGGSKLRVTFDAAALPIPPLNWKTGSMFNVPIPPPLNIQIIPERLEGVIDTASGQVELEFDARFMFTAGKWYAAPPLFVKTLLTTETSKGAFRQATGSRLKGTTGTLVGTATVPRTGDAFMDIFLMLPSDALAIMVADWVFETSE